MKKTVFILLCIIVSLAARENPFSPQKLIVIEPNTTAPTIEKKPLQLKELNITKKIEPKIELIKPIPVKTHTIPMIKEGKKTLVTIKEKTPIVKVKPKKKKIHKKRKKSKLIYNGRFAKVKVKGSSIKILTQDSVLKHFTLKYPNRLVIDFERFDVVRPFNKKVYTQKVKSLKVGHHDYFYRMTFKLGKNYRYKVKKRPYGYLIKLY